MQDKTTDPLFIVQYELDIPPIEPMNVLMHTDILAQLQDAGQDRATPYYNPSLDFFSCVGMSWRLANTMYLTRLINTDHTEALDWLQKRGYDVRGKAMGWIIEFLFDTGRILLTGNRSRIEEAVTVDFGESKFAIMDTAAVNLSRVVSVNTYQANLDILNEQNSKARNRR